MTFTFALVCAVAVGCGTLPPCPAKGGPPWRELTTDHFRLRTDLDEADAREAARVLEEIRAAMLTVVWPGRPEPTDRIDVVALGSQTELRTFVPSGTFGFWLRPSIPFSGTIVIGGAPSGANLGWISHELFHCLSHWFMTVQPPWYGEGLATFLETLRYDRASGRVVFGTPPSARLEAVTRRSRSSVETVSPGPRFLDAAAIGEGDEAAAYEDWAWLLVHYLVNTHLKAFGRIQERLGLLSSAREAWTLELPDVPPERLRDVLLDYLHRGKFSVGDARVTVPTLIIALRTMSDAEVHSVRAHLYGVSASFVPQRQKEVSESLRLDPGAVESTALKFYDLSPKTQGSERSDLATRVQTTHPEHWMSWLMVADATVGRARRTALVRALRLGLEQAPVLSRFAALEGEEGRWGEALSFSVKAVRRRSAEPELFFTHMHAAGNVGRCAEGARFAQALSGMVHPGHRKEIADAWATLEPRCKLVEAEKARLESQPAAPATPLGDASPEVPP